MQQGRTKFVAKNISIGLLCQLINAILGFVVRYYFIVTLGVEYLGVNGLFTNILQFLSLVELGIGSAIVYRLYAPLKENNTEKLKAWMKIYRQAYTFIGITVIILGCGLAPFMPWLIKDAPEVHENLYVIFLLFVINSGISYFFIYKQSLVIADQKNYIVSLIRQIGKLVQSIVQIVILLTTHNFIIFLITGIIFTLLINISISKDADRRYPLLREKVHCNINHIERKSLFDDVKSLIIFKVGYVILNNTNNIIISLVLGIAYVGLGSNYFLITGALEIIIDQFFGAFTASVGNFNVDKTPDEKLTLFKHLNYILISFCGFIFSGTFLFANDFINLWLGKDDFILSKLSVFSIILFIFFKNSGAVCFMFRTTQGAFKQVKYVPIIVATFHIILAVFLVQILGFAGIFLSSSLAMLSIDLYDAFVVSRVSQFSYRSYISLFFSLIFLIVMSGFTAYLISDSLMPIIDSWAMFIVKVIAYSGIYILIYLILSYFMESSFRQLIVRIKSFTNSK